MRQFVHYGYDLNPGVDVREIDDCIICEWNGLRYSIDRTKILVEPMVMADEIMLLNDKDLEDVKVLWRRNLLWSSIKSVLMDSGLI